MTSPTEELLWRPVCYGEAVYLVSDFLCVRVMDVERLTLSTDDGGTVYSQAVRLYCSCVMWYGGDMFALK